MEQITARQEAISIITNTEVREAEIDYTEIPVTELFGSKVFNDVVMRERLPKNIYKSLKKTIDLGLPLEAEVADVVATAMKDWAIEHGATHYTHWFHPLTGLTAEKHDSFINPTGSGKVIMDFGGDQLIKGEPDASSFPSGGIRATFEARGYTAWDCTSPAFIRGTTLVIPTAFCSYTGEALDKKTPLLRSIDALSQQALRILKLFGNTTSPRVVTTVGPEQEYFLIDKNFYNLRPDLIATGRTLYGARPIKGQESEDHYFGSIKDRIQEYMEDVESELWALGVTVKTRHNEVAPAQYEIAPIFTTTNVAMDHNQLVMDILKKVANKHGLACLLHEKPFKGVNGSGKHNNWSMATTDGHNLLEPGDNPHENAQFLVFLVATIKAVDMFGDLLRVSISNPGNDHRLGANEAPPAILSVFLGDQLNDIIEQIAEAGGAKSSKKGSFMQVGVSTIPSLPKDTTDRNRTSPFAFTGNKFEFRAVPSSLSIGGPNLALNTAVAYTLDLMATAIEKEMSSGKTLEKAVEVVLADEIKKHKKIIFNGDNYTEEWQKEAAKRGLPNLKTLVDALPVLKEDRIVNLFGRYSVLSAREVESRYNIILEDYNKSIVREGIATHDIGKTKILPACIKYQKDLADSINASKSVLSDADLAPQIELLKEVSLKTSKLKLKLDELNKILAHEDSSDDVLKHATYCKDKIIPAMNTAREIADELELLVDTALWPLPTYSEMLFIV
ncbi:MAG: glutamine synthetase III [Leptospiraceae bacterium]|nr:glutamine synthetase III [Leptospiraceae bacterium]MCP5499475.1 glutamine synthetase III [Leptospiraceae bacterium]